MQSLVLKQNCRRSLLLFGITWTTLVAPTMSAQMSIAPHIAHSSARNSSDAKTVAFDAVSIRPSKYDGPGGGGATSYGYTATGIALQAVIMYAYYPLPSGYWRDGRLLGVPPWMAKARYDIKAKVDDATENEWKGLSNAQRRERVKPMLRTMLEDRCKLVLHSTTTEAPIYALMVGRHKPKLKVSKPDEPLPAGSIKVSLASSGAGPGVVVPHVIGGKPQDLFFGTPMTSLAIYLSDFSDRPIEDRTGLTGQYDFVLSPRENSQLQVKQPSGSTSDLDPASFYDVEELGLVLKPAKGLAETLVIDHIEKPSEN